MCACTVCVLKSTGNNKRKDYVCACMCWLGTVSIHEHASMDRCVCGWEWLCRTPHTSAMGYTGEISP